MFCNESRYTISTHLQLQCTVRTSKKHFTGCYRRLGSTYEKDNNVSISSRGLLPGANNSKHDQFGQEKSTFQWYFETFSNKLQLCCLICLYLISNLLCAIKYKHYSKYNVPDFIQIRYIMFKQTVSIRPLLTDEKDTT